MTLLLTPQLEQFIQSQIESGKYTSVNEVIIAALKLLEEKELYQGRFKFRIQQDDYKPRNIFLLML